MCEFFSAVICKDGRILCSDGKSHEGIEVGWNLKPGEYREFEWTSENPNTLYARMEENEEKGFWLSLILSQFKTRSELLAQITEGRGDGVIYHLQNGLRHRDDGPAIEWTNGDKQWYRNGQLHRDDGPAIEYVSGHKQWYRNGQLHRDDGPAIEYVNGDKEWYRNGLRHREDGPAIEQAGGNKEWYRNGQLHRDDGPAIEYANGSKEWWRDGKLHREDGPAIEWANGNKEWWQNGKFIDWQGK